MGNCCRKKRTKRRDSSVCHEKVMKMFSLPVEHRWKIASTFTKAEHDYAVRVQMRQMASEDFYYSADCACDETFITTDCIGDSDDGTI